MRYFFVLPVPEPLLACSVVMAARRGRTVAAARLAKAFPAGLHSTRTRTVVISPVTVTADKDLTTAAGTGVVADTRQHRHGKADEGWISTGSSATLNRLCESTVWGMVPVLTLKSRPGAMPVSSAPSSYRYYGFLSPGFAQAQRQRRAHMRTPWGIPKKITMRV